MVFTQVFFVIIEGVGGKKSAKVTLVLISNSFFVKGSEKGFAKRILQSIRCHLESFFHAYLQLCLISLKSCICRLQCD